MSNIDPTLSIRANARKFGISRHTAKRRLEPYMRQDNVVEQLSDLDAFFKEKGIDPANVQITSRGISERDPVTGSWTKVSWKPVVQGAQVDVEALESIFSDWTPTIPLEALTGAPMVVCAADLQVGKTSLLGGTIEMAARVRASFESAAAIAEFKKPRAIVLADLGDIIENFCNTSEQRQTNDLSLTDQITTAWRLIMEGIKLLSQHTTKLYYVAVPSNHGRVRLGPKAPAGHVNDDFGLMIAQTIKDVCAAHPDLQHVEVIVPAPLEVAVTLEVGGTVLGFTHGDQATSGQKVGDWWKGQSHGRRSGLNLVDILLSGHWHSLNIYQSGDERWVMVAPTSDAGSGWFTNRTGESSTPGMLTFFVSNGMWHDLLVV